MNKISKRTLNNLKDVDIRLQAVILYALATSEVDFTVIEGRRSIQRQRKLYAAKKTKTLKSKHLAGLAVDIYHNQGWDNKEVWDKLIKHVKEVATHLNIKIVCGHDWRWDSPHIELM